MHVGNKWQGNNPSVTDLCKQGHHRLGAWEHHEMLAALSAKCCLRTKPRQRDHLSQ